MTWSCEILYTCIYPLKKGRYIHVLNEKYIQLCKAKSYAQAEKNNDTAN